LDSERESYRLVILLTLVQSVRAMLSILEWNATGSSGAGSSGRSTPGSPLASSSKDTEKEKSDLLLKRMRLAPVLGLEGKSHSICKLLNQQKSIQAICEKNSELLVVSLPDRSINVGCTIP
jgi:hypothetical protein